MLDDIKKNLNDSMNKAIQSLSKQLTKVRTGRANPSLFDGVKVDYYGTLTPIKQLGQLSTPEARMLQIQPFDKSMITEIEKSIINSNLGVTPNNDGNLIRVVFPALTEDSRKDIVKDIKKFGEDAKIAIRNSRRDQNEIVKKSEKSKELSEDDSKKYQAEIQKITDTFVKKVDEVIETKEKEILTI